MSKKVLTVIISLFLIFSSLTSSFAQTKKTPQLATEKAETIGKKDNKADNATAKNNGKVIVIDISRTNLENINNIKFLRKTLENNGSIALMNIRGDKGYDERRNYASMGSTARADIRDDILLNFTKATPDSKAIYKAATGQSPESINLQNINSIDLYNKSKGEYKSDMGFLGQTLKSNGKKVSVLGNSDYYDDMGKYVKNRDFCLAVMDSKGRIENGEVDNINKKDAQLPYGISTNYEKLLAETKKEYVDSNLLFINMGDTYRLDKYKPNLNEATYKKMKFSIYNKISKYLEDVFAMASKNDTIYVLGTFPSDLDYANNRRLSPVIRFDMSNKTTGLLKSATTRRNGVVANMDIGVDILNRFGIKNDEMFGRVMASVGNSNPTEYLKSEYKKIISISSIRMSIINIYVTVISVSWVIAVLALWKKNKLPEKHRDSILSVLKEMVKFGLIMPLAFLTAPILQPDSEVKIAIYIVLISFIYYFIGRKLFDKDDIKQIGFFSLMMILLITIDSIISTPMMMRNIMSYDPMIGARYYGIGNEYEGVTIGSAILGFAVLHEYKKIPKFATALLLLVILFTSAYPGMGANVGGAISECVAYLTFILLLYNVKFDLKKVILILCSAALLVIAFAVADIVLGTGSHLGNFVEQIKINGPLEIVYVFGRKIAMNVQLAQTTIWVNILLVGLFILAVGIYRPNKQFLELKEEHSIIYKGFLATIAGCLVTLIVNDSGIIAAATCSIYLLIPIIILMINKKKLGEKNVIR